MVHEKNPAPVDMVNIPIIYRVSYMSGGCLGFLPSTGVREMSRSKVQTISMKNMAALQLSTLMSNYNFIQTYVRPKISGTQGDFARDILMVDI